MDVQRERMEFDRESLCERMELEGAMLELEKQHKLMKMELEKEKNDAFIMKRINLI